MSKTFACLRCGKIVSVDPPIQVQEGTLATCACGQVHQIKAAFFPKIDNGDDDDGSAGKDWTIIAVILLGLK